MWLLKELYPLQITFAENRGKYSDTIPSSTVHFITTSYEDFLANDIEDIHYLHASMYPDKRPSILYITPLDRKGFEKSVMNEIRDTVLRKFSMDYTTLINGIESDTRENFFDKGKILEKLNSTIERNDLTFLYSHGYIDQTVNIMITSPDYMQALFKDETPPKSSYVVIHSSELDSEFVFPINCSGNSIYPAGDIDGPSGGIGREQRREIIDMMILAKDPMYPFEPTPNGGLQIKRKYLD